MILEKTLIIIKPDIKEIGLVKEIINILESKKLEIVEMKIVQLTSKKAEDFYQEHKGKDWFKKMIKFMCSYPVVVMCLKGVDAIKISREIIGATNPQEAEIGTIRKIYGKSIDNNAIHGSDSQQAAEREIKFFFSEKKLT